MKANLTLSVCALARGGWVHVAQFSTHAGSVFSLYNMKSNIGQLKSSELETVIAVVASERANVESEQAPKGKQRVHRQLARDLKSIEQKLSGGGGFFSGDECKVLHEILREMLQGFAGFADSHATGPALVESVKRANPGDEYPMRAGEENLYLRLHALCG